MLLVIRWAKVVIVTREDEKRPIRRGAWYDGEACAEAAERASSVRSGGMEKDQRTRKREREAKRERGISFWSSIL
ncbi:hypothetical protein SRHO_G00239800 [Serrasalmus rhombeus]